MPTTVRLDPSSARLTLHTGRAGAAARVGHDLVLGVGSWRAEVTVDGTTLTAVRATAETTSITVLEGHGGLKPLSGGDRATIEKNVQKILHGTTVQLVAEGPLGPVDGAAGPSTLTGALGVAGVTRDVPVTVEAHVTDGVVEVRARLEVVQTDFGITPYSAMLGALRLRDSVEVLLAATLPLPA